MGCMRVCPTSSNRPYSSTASVFLSQPQPDDSDPLAFAELPAIMALALTLLRLLVASRWSSTSVLVMEGLVELPRDALWASAADSVCVWLFSLHAEPTFSPGNPCGICAKHCIVLRVFSTSRVRTVRSV